MVGLTVPPFIHMYIPERKRCNCSFENWIASIFHFFPQNFQINLCAGQTEFLVWLPVWKCQRTCTNSEQNYTEYTQVDMFMIRSSRWTCRLLEAPGEHVRYQKLRVNTWLIRSSVSCWLGIKIQQSLSSRSLAFIILIKHTRKSVMTTNRYTKVHSNKRVMKTQRL